MKVHRSTETTKPVVDSEPNVKGGDPVPEAPLAPAAQALSALKLELARRQLELVPAQAYAQKAIAKAPRVKTDPRLELAIDAAFREADPEAAKRLLEDAHARGGAQALGLAVSIFEAQAGAWFEQDPGVVEAILGAVAAHALDLLAKEPPATDHRAALASMVAANRALGCGRSLYSTYSPIDRGVASCDAFTNEPGFPDLADQLDVEGGAVVGVSGAILELGARGADLVVSVDANPAIPRMMLLFSALLLAADRTAQAEGLNADQQAELFSSFIEGGASPETLEQLRDIGYPAELLDEVNEQLDALKAMLERGAVRGWKMPKAVWCKGPNAGEHIRHLTQLALQGRIVAVSADLADEEVVSRINRVLSLHDLSAKVIHFSNALDYIPNVRGTFRNFERIDRTDSAVITTTAYFVRQAGERRHDTELTNALGTLEEPAALPASDWFGERADRLHELLWSDPTHRQQLTRDTYRRMGKAMPETPADYEGYVAMVERDAR